MNDTEKQISIAATVMALTFIVVFVGVILIGTLGGEIGLMFVKIVSFTILCAVVLGGAFWVLKEMFTCLLEDYVAYKEPDPSAFDAIRESLAKLQASREKKRMKMTKSKKESVKEALTSKTTWLAIVIEFGIIFLVILAVAFFGTDVIAIALLLVMFFIIATLIKEMLDDMISRK